MKLSNIMKTAKTARLASAMTLALTTIHQPCEQLAEVAYEALMRRIAAPESPPQRILLHAPLVERESTMSDDDRRQRQKRKGGAHAVSCGKV